MEKYGLKYQRIQKLRTPNPAHHTSCLNERQFVSGRLLLVIIRFLFISMSINYEAWFHYLPTFYISHYKKDYYFANYHRFPVIVLHRPPHIGVPVNLFSSGPQLPTLPHHYIKVNNQMSTEILLSEQCVKGSLVADVCWRKKSRLLFSLFFFKDRSKVGVEHRTPSLPKM